MTTHEILAEVQTWHEARGRACDTACGPLDRSNFLDRSDWFAAHPVWEFEGWRLAEVLAEVHAVDRRSLSVAAPVRLPRRPIIPEDRQLEIAMDALDNRRPAHTRAFIGRTA